LLAGGVDGRLDIGPGQFLERRRGEVAHAGLAGTSGQRYVDDARFAGKRALDVPIDDEHLGVGHGAEHVLHQAAVQIDDELGSGHEEPPKGNELPARNPVDEMPA
jgi:hypothetical protein